MSIYMNFNLESIPYSFGGLRPRPFDLQTVNRGVDQFGYLRSLYTFLYVCQLANYKAAFDENQLIKFSAASIDDHHLLKTSNIKLFEESLKLQKVVATALICAVLHKVSVDYRQRMYPGYN